MIFHSYECTQKFCSVAKMACNICISFLLLLILSFRFYEGFSIGGMIF